jgi:tetratricopeptide (TPR) repeat protein
MIGVRRAAPVLWTALLVASGCGSSTSASKSYDHLVAAAQAIEAGDQETAMAELSASLEKSPSAWAYFERARLHLEQGREQEALADCQKGLELDPKNGKLKWLSTELKKPSVQRFKGRFAKPPLI